MAIPVFEPLAPVSTCTRKQAFDEFKHLPLKREIVRVGNGEKIEFQDYQKFILLSNSI